MIGCSKTGDSLQSVGVVVPDLAEEVAFLLDRFRISGLNSAASGLKLLVLLPLFAMSATGCDLQMNVAKWSFVCTLPATRMCDTQSGESDVKEGLGGLTVSVGGREVAEQRELRTRLWKDHLKTPQPDEIARRVQ